MRVILTSFLALLFLLWSQDSIALSEYGRKCDDNPECRKCRDSSVECQKCMNKCWNMYGPAELTELTTKVRGRDELCRIKRSKWCSAQCWDPDDMTKPNYVSTKPKCSDSSFPKYKNVDEKPW